MSDTDSGRDLLRAALKARHSKINLSSFGRDLGMNSDTLHNAIFNETDLTPDQWRAVCQYLLPHTIWDETTDKLMPKNRAPAISQGIMPSLDPKLLPKYRPGAAQTAHRLVNDSPPDLKPKTRPGWLGGWG